jgi:hypothetical protein
MIITGYTLHLGIFFRGIYRYTGFRCCVDSYRTRQQLKSTNTIPTQSPHIRQLVSQRHDDNLCYFLRQLASVPLPSCMKRTSQTPRWSSTFCRTQRSNS